MQPLDTWHAQEAPAVLEALDADARQGLSEQEAARRLARHGPNELVERGLKSPWRILWEQLTAVMVLVLLAAAAVSLALGDYKDAAAILVIVVLNALLGLRQEYRAEKAMAALKRMAVPRVKVRRGGQLVEIPSRDLVPGDIAVLEVGNLVPADCRLVEAVNLRAQEAALTGESEAVEKDAAARIAPDAPLGDRRNMAYMGTVVSYGRGLGVVAATGMNTELGRIASMIQTVRREPTPLQKRLDHLGKRLALLALVLVTVLFCEGILREGPARFREMFMTAVSMAVAAVPEGLPAVVTIALALGAQRMLRRHALIRKLPAVETLGSVTVICSDKTGTLTENRMTVTVLDVAGHTLELAEMLRAGQPILDLRQDESLTVEKQSSLALLLTAAALCNDAELKAEEGSPGVFRAVGDPTEGSLVVAAAHGGLQKPDLAARFPRVAEVPFDSGRKRMTTIHRLPAAEELSGPLAPLAAWRSLAGAAGHVALTKGGVDQVLQVSSGVWVDGTVLPLDDGLRQRIAEANDRMARRGMRVLGMACRFIPGEPRGGEEAAERDLVFIGMAGMIDPPRREVAAAVATCRAAGIRPVMITGDHPLTAVQIARELGIAADGGAITGQDLARMPVAELAGVVDEASVYARVSPEHKLNIVQALQDRGHIVAMTGDGVNDAPALKKADIGVAMGITGTDVSKEAADMVLMDDNFATIVAAVEEGRAIYDNMRKFIKYLLSCNTGELLAMLLAPLLGMPLPLLPLQILWMNLVTDGLPALALGIEPAERDTMRRPPYPPGESIFARGAGWQILWAGALMALVSLGMGWWAWSSGRHDWQTMVFTTMTLSQMGNALAMRSERRSLLQIGLFSNLPLLGAVVATVLLQLALIYTPVLQGIFHTAAMSPADLGVSLGLSAVVFVALEIDKAIRRRSAPGPSA